MLFLVRGGSEGAGNTFGRGGDGAFIRPRKICLEINLTPKPCSRNSRRSSGTFGHDVNDCFKILPRDHKGVIM